jgi:hypothetical protein
MTKTDVEPLSFIVVCMLQHFASLAHGTSQPATLDRHEVLVDNWQRIDNEDQILITVVQLFQ